MTAPELTPATKSGVPAGVIAIGRSLLINVLGSWLAFKLLAPHVPEHSVVPLLASVAVPALYMVWELVKARTLDGVAVIQLTLTGLSALIGLLFQDQHAALIAMAFQAMGLGLVFGVSALFGRPLIQAMARQATSGNDPQAGAEFDKAVAEIPAVRRLMMTLSAMWCGVLACETGVRLIMVQSMPASSYILAANIMGYGVPAALVWMSIRMGDGLEAKLRAAPELASDTQAS
jgi:hypothetical protein